MHEQEYLRDAIRIIILASWYILSEMSAVTFLGFFNFVFSPLWRGCWQGPLNSRKRVNFRRWCGQIVIFLISSFSTPNLPAWLSISLNSGKCYTLCDAVVLLPAAPTLTSRCVTSRSKLIKGRLTAGSHGLELSLAPQISSSFQKVHLTEDMGSTFRRKVVYL